MRKLNPKLKLSGILPTMWYKSEKITEAMNVLLKSSLPVFLPIRRYNDGRDITYLLNFTPSLITTSDAGSGIGYTSLRVRGTDASRINITANGIPVNDSESHNVYWVNMPDFASSLRDVQIQRGVGTSVNGAAAFGASINMITDAPSETPYAELSGAYGSYNTNRETLRVGSGLLGGHWSFDARLSHLSSDGYIDRATSKLWSYFGQEKSVRTTTPINLLWMSCLNGWKCGTPTTSLSSITRTTTPALPKL